MKTVIFCLHNINRMGGIEYVTKTLTLFFHTQYRVVIINTKKTTDESKCNLPNDIIVKNAFGNKIIQIFKVFFYLLRFKSSVLFIQGKNLYYLTTLAKISRCKICFCDHDSFLAYPLSQKNEYLPRKRAVAFADKIIVLTKECKEGYISIFNVSPNKIILIPNFLDLPKEKIAYNQHSKTIVAVGRYHQQKRFDLLIKAFKIFSLKNNDFILEIYGDGELRDNLQDLINSEGLQKRVFLKGKYKSLNEAYCNKSFLVMTSNNEGFPIVILEALHYKLPIISFNYHSGPADAIKDGFNGFLVEQGDIDNLADKMSLLSGNKEMRIKQSENSIYFNNKFSKQKILQIWINLIENK